MNGGRQLTARTVAVTAVLMILVLVNAILETIPGLALPVIQRAMQITPAEGGLLVASLTLMAAISTPIVGKLGDAYGPRKILLGAVVLVVIGAVLSGAALSYPAMIAGQMLQGVGFGILPLTFSLLRSLWPAKWIKSVVGIVTSMAVLGIGAGFLMVGPVSETLSWHWLFGLPAALGAVAVVAAWWLVPSVLREDDAARPRVGWPGAISFAAFLVALTVTISAIPMVGWAEAAVMLGVVVVLGGGWILLELRGRVPFISLQMIRRRGIWTANVVALVQGAGTTVAVILLPQLITLPKQTGIGLGGSLTEVGLYLFPLSVAGMLGAPLGGVVCQRIGARSAVMMGLSVQLLGTLGLVVLHGEPWQLAVMTALTGFGGGLTSTGMYNLAISSSSSNETGISTGLNNIARATGSALGSVVGVTILTTSINPLTKLPTSFGFIEAFMVAAGITVVGLVVALVMPGNQKLAAVEVLSQPDPAETTQRAA